MAMIPAPVNPIFCAPQVVQFIIEQKVFTISSGKFVINDAFGRHLFSVKSKLPSLHVKRVLCDANGHPLVLLTKKVLTMHDSWEATSETDHDKMLFTMKKSNLLQLKPSFNVFLGLNTSKPDFTLKGDFFQFNYTVYHHDMIVAQVNKQINASAILVGKDQYVVTIQPGVDQAFIAALVVIMDQVAQDDKAE
ncbi:hypothetical protein R1sor_006724 [Riccia sorocarpa]|uniref:Uncharacterized protein n=1 Tax=Riccia sorocarpa TaxID=122646 RepID=A0ABD3HNV4_9MARC